MLAPYTIVAIAGYTLGALPFGYVVARAKGVNIFQEGSRNPGATNVKRVLGEKFGAEGRRLGNLVFALDALKGAAAAGWMLLGAWFLGDAFLGGPDTRLYCQVLGLVMALVGHSFSCFTGFRGGKGVATAAGAFLVLMPLATLVAAAVWVGTFYASRYVSLASILAAASLPLAAWLFGRPPLVLGIAAAVAAFVILRHRANIGRLLNGTENRFARRSDRDAGPGAAK